jgi:DtxR family Mn-dependent transcriptional regulator
MRHSEEQYLKTIFMLSKDKDEVCSSDIASLLGYSRASVSKAMKILKEDGYIVMEPYSKISLTRDGYERAGDILERESIISEFLKKTLDINDQLSAKYSAYVGHVIDSETLEKMKFA